jgi:hypothetical protein
MLYIYGIADLVQQHKLEHMPQGPLVDLFVSLIDWIFFVWKFAVKGSSHCNISSLTLEISVAYMFADHVVLASCTIVHNGVYFIFHRIEWYRQ